MATLPKVVGRIRDLRAAVGGFKAEGAQVALVPTMGALHAGHVALAEKAREIAQRTVVSIFVNPTQFAPHEDFSRYPRTLEEDLFKLADVGVDLVYAPTATEMYPAGFAARIEVGGPSAGLESDFRPHFFGGVATVVGKLFIQCAPHFAVFGEKDYQQLKVVTRLSRDLDLGVEVVGLPTIREEDGLALSSRNAYLDEEQRRIAPVIYTALARAADAIRSGAPADAAVATARGMIEALGLKVDYVAARNADTLAPLKDRGEPVRLLAAAWLGDTRLIDNIPV
ncbi:pantoate--beta-alanine ligase [Xanthobacter dioxanivorans]|uniref:Pantothenate synthetase n=1 Tax=Xanthobacter dioxanivorans TaxID=2528964 RepID=A0A974PLC9_9HYPH|nr:pantoate--beta-alanine ligase [Xanthobacter dioxanivorans]QRG05329.1 pantoate--beta-alanine ligase [Xanthobacter dioxanivorans]